MHLRNVVIASLVICGSVSSAYAVVYEAGTVAELNDALSKVNPGDTINLKDGTYTKVATITRSGADGKPITLTGSANAIITNPGGYALYLNGASFWLVKGITVKLGLKGIMLDASQKVIIDGVTVTEIDGEAVHFRKSSSDCTIQNSNIFNSGYKYPGMGEGILIGSANANWAKVMGAATKPDQSNRNKILNNKLGPKVDSELIDAKEGTRGGVIRGNTFDGEGMSGANAADSWVDVKGNDYLIENNTGINALLDGFQVHYQLDGEGCTNIFRANTAKLTAAAGVAINLTTRKCSNVVTKTNTATGGAGVVNAGVPLQ